MTVTIETEAKQGHTYVQWLIACLANLTLLTYATQESWIMPMQKVLQSENSPLGYPLSDNEISLVASIICIPAMASVPTFSWLADKYGRKAIIILISVLQAICWAIPLISPNTVSLIISRLICGLGAGGSYNVVPMYIREISQDDIRGTLGSILSLFQTIGLLIMYLMGAYLGYFTILWILVWIPVATALLMLAAPESPAYLVKIGKTDEAAATLSMLRGLNVAHKAVQTEMDAMKNEEEYYKSLPKISLINILKNKSWRRGIYLILMLNTVQMNNGNYAIQTYAEYIFVTSGVTVRPELQAVLIPIVMMIASVISLNFVERIGRKPLLMILLSVATLSHCVLASTILLQKYGVDIPGWVAVVATLVYETTYAGGIVTLPVIIMTEMFNFQIRATVMGYLVSHVWFVAFVHLYTFTPMVNALGMHASFYYYAIINLIGILFCITFLPETRGKNTHQIDQDLAKMTYLCT